MIHIFATVAGISLLTLLAACSGGTTPTATPSPTQPTAQELKLAAQGLFDVFAASIQSRDGAALHEIFVSDLRERCTVEQMQESFGSGEATFPNAEIDAVFLNLEDPSSAFMRLALKDQPEGSPETSASGLALAFPFPMALEEGGWRLDFPALVLPQEGGCPFAGGSSQDGTRQADRRMVDATPQPALPRLAPPPGAQAIASGSGGGSGEYNASVLLETDLTLVALLEYYRQNVVQPDWTVQQETLKEGLAALTWTFRDDGDHPWFGVLLIAPADDGQMWVRQWSGSGTRAAFMLDEQGREPRVPAPTKPN